MLETVRAGREVPYAWRRRRRGLPRGLLRTDSPSARSRTTTVRPKSGRASRRRRRRKPKSMPVVFCSTLRCEARFSIGRLARKLRHETLLRRGLRPDKTRSKNPGAPWLLAWLCKASSAAKIVIAASRAHRDVTFSRQAVTSAPALTSPQNTQSLRCAPIIAAAPRAQMSTENTLVDHLLSHVDVKHCICDFAGGYAAADLLARLSKSAPTD